MNKIRSCVTEDNFKKMLNGSIVNNKVTEATTIASGSWAWNDLYKAIHVNDDSTSIKATTDINLGFLKVGDKVTLSAEFFNISGTKGKISLDFADNVLFTVVGGTALTVNSKTSGLFETVEVEFTVKKDAYYKALFGIFTADIGEFYLRNCVAKIRSIVDLEMSNYKQVTKLATIKSLGDGAFERDTRFGVDNFTITTNANYLVLTWDKPFTYGSARPIAFGDKDSTSSKYNVRTTGVQVNTVTIQFYDISTNNLVNHNAIPSGVYASFMVIGYDIY